METWTGNNFTWWSPAPPRPTSSKWSPRSRSSSWISLTVADVSCQHLVHCQWQREDLTVGRCLMILIVRAFSMFMSKDCFFFYFLPLALWCMNRDFKFEHIFYINKKCLYHTIKYLVGHLGKFSVKFSIKQTIQNLYYYVPFRRLLWKI